MKSVSIILAIIIVSVCLVGCKDIHAHNEGGEHDAITTVTLTFVDATDTSKVVTAVWEDLDGIGGANPNRIDTIMLDKAKAYKCSVQLENRSVTPPINVTEDVSA